MDLQLKPKIAAKAAAKALKTAANRNSIIDGSFCISCDADGQGFSFKFRSPTFLHEFMVAYNDLLGFEVEKTDNGFRVSAEYIDIK